MKWIQSLLILVIIVVGVGIGIAGLGFIKRMIPPFHGITVQFHEACSVPFNETDYARFQRWGLNSIYYQTYWSIVEPNETVPGFYDEILLMELHNQVALARQYGLYPFIGVRGPYNVEGEAWRGWMDKWGWDHINLDTDPLSLGMGGRVRYMNLLTMFATRFPDCGIGLTFFPYHQDSATEDETSTLYTVTLPALYDSVREVTDEYIHINPLYQGNDDNWVGGLTTGQYLDLEKYEWTPFPFPTGRTRDAKVILGFNNHGKDDNQFIVVGGRWDYNYTRIDEHYAPLLLFQEKYRESGVTFGCAESTPLNVHDIYQGNEGIYDNTIRPIDPSRLAWMKAHLQIMRNHRMSWWYYKYSHKVFYGDDSYNPMESDGRDTAIAQLITEYS